MKIVRLAVVSTGAIAAACLAYPIIAADGPDSGPVARYDMRAGTNSGFGGMGQGNMAAMMMGGGGSQVQHELLLRLGSDNAAANGKPEADHFMPEGAKLGRSVELVTPTVERGPVDEIPSPQPNQRPTGRILIFWGCGDHAPKGQPYVIDLEKLSRGELPPGDSPWTTTILADWGPNLTNSKTFGRWPAEDGKYAKPDSSLIGAHRVAGNYSPEIDFTLAKDFMQPLAITVTGQPTGSRLLSWNSVLDATGYHASLFGGKQGPNGQMGDLVMWSSSETRQFGGGLSDWLTPAQVAPLVRDGTLIPPQATQCKVPAEVIAAAPDFRMGTLTAFGPMESFSYPPKPSDPKAKWNLLWTARIRHRSMTNWMEAQGMSMGTTADASYANYADTDTDEPDQPKPECKPKKKRGLGGLGGALGGALGGSLGRAAGTVAEQAATTETCE